MNAYETLLSELKKRIIRILKGSLENYFRVSKANDTDKAKFLKEYSVADLIDANSNEIQEAIYSVLKHSRTVVIFNKDQAKAFRADIDTFLGNLTFEDILK